MIKEEERHSNWKNKVKNKEEKLNKERKNGCQRRKDGKRKMKRENQKKNIHKWIKNTIPNKVVIIFL